MKSMSSKKLADKTLANKPMCDHQIRQSFFNRMVFSTLKGQCVDMEAVQLHAACEIKMTRLSTRIY